MEEQEPESPTPTESPSPSPSRQPRKVRAVAEAVLLGIVSTCLLAATISAAGLQLHFGLIVIQLVLLYWVVSSIDRILGLLFPRPGRAAYPKPRNRPPREEPEPYRYQPRYLEEEECLVWMAGMEPPYAHVEVRVDADETETSPDPIAMELANCLQVQAQEFHSKLQLFLAEEERRSSTSGLSLLHISIFADGGEIWLALEDSAGCEFRCACSLPALEFRWMDRPPRD